ncbi:hypothetical protein GCM10027190_59530 [Spirosoma areae]
MAFVTLNCGEKEIKVFNELLGKYTGYIVNFGNNSSTKKDLTLTITSQDNPVAGTYNLAGTAGTVSGSVLGTILNLTLKPTASGTTYTFSGNANDDNTAITGTMTGVESGTAVKYTVDLKK